MTTLTSHYAICHWIPLFPLRCEERRRHDLVRKPLALLAPTDTRRIWQASHMVRRTGVRPGMTVSQAIGLCPTLVLLEPDPVHYDEQFTHLIGALGNVTPVVEPVELGRVFVGVDGLEKLVGGPERQLDAVMAAIDGDGLRRATSPGHELRDGRERRWAAVARLGWGRGKFVSWVAATRAQPGSPVIVRDTERAAFLARQRVGVLPLSTDAHMRLQQLGLKTLGDVARLPESALVSQFGREGRSAWHLAAGNEHEPVTGSEHPEPIVAAMHFPAPVADRAMLLHAMHKLVERALNHPRRRGWRVSGIRVRATLEHGASWRIEAIPKNPSAHIDRIVAPLAVRLEQSPPSGSIEYLAVEFVALVHGTDELQLFARDAASAARAGRRSALSAAAGEIQHRLKRPLLHHIIEVQPWSRIPERRYALIDFEH